MSKMNQNVVVPEGSMLLNTEEMRAVEGGFKVYLNDETCMGIITALAIEGPTALASMSIPAVVAAVQAGAATLATILSTIPGVRVGAGLILGALGLCATDFAIALVGAAKNRRGMDINFGFASGGFGIDCVARKKK